MTPDEIPFAKLLGIEADSVEPGHAVLSMKIREDLLRNGGIAHGGAIAALIDSAMAFAIVPLLLKTNTARQSISRFTTCDH